MLADELLVMSPLRHPNVILLLGACFDDGCNVGMVLEHAAHGDLLNVLEKSRGDASFSWDDPLRRMAQDVARGLAYLHGRHPPVIHRDVKSPNVLVSHTYSCKLADFGLSRGGGGGDDDDAQKRDAPRSFEPRRQTLVGTPPYMSPELLAGAPGDEASDIYAFGVVLVEMANRAPPYSTAADDRVSSVPALLAAVEAGRRPAIVGDMPDAIRGVARACLDGDPNARPSAHDAVLSFVSVPAEAPPAGASGDGDRRRRRSAERDDATSDALARNGVPLGSSLWSEEDCAILGSLY